MLCSCRPRYFVLLLLVLHSWIVLRAFRVATCGENLEAWNCRGIKNLSGKCPQNLWFLEYCTSRALLLGPNSCERDIIHSVIFSYCIKWIQTSEQWHLVLPPPLMPLVANCLHLQLLISGKVNRFCAVCKVVNPSWSQSPDICCLPWSVWSGDLSFCHSHVEGNSSCVMNVSF